MNHPAIDRLQAAINSKVRVTARAVRHMVFYTVRADSFEHVGQSTTVHMAVEDFLRNNGLAGYPDVYAEHQF